MTYGSRHRRQCGVLPSSSRTKGTEIMQKSVSGFFNFLSTRAKLQQKRARLKSCLKGQKRACQEVYE